MEIILICTVVLLIIYVFGYSNLKKNKSSNSYDAFVVSGIGKTETNNALFNTRKMPKSNEKNSEFNITDKIGVIFKDQEKTLLSKENKEKSLDEINCNLFNKIHIPKTKVNQQNSQEIYISSLKNETCTSVEDSSDIEVEFNAETESESSVEVTPGVEDSSSIEVEFNAETESKSSIAANSSESESAPVEKPDLLFSDENEEVTTVVNDLLNKYKNKYQSARNAPKKNSLADIDENLNVDIDENLNEVLQQESKWREDIQRKKTDSNNSFSKQNSKDTTRRYQRNQIDHTLEMEKIISESKNNQSNELNDIFSGVEDVLEEVKELKKTYKGFSREEFINLKSEESREKNTSDQKFSYRDDFIAYQEKKQDSSVENKSDNITSSSFVKKAQSIVEKYQISESFESTEKVLQKSEKLFSRKKNYDRSEVVDEWRKKLGFWT